MKKLYVLLCAMVAIATGATAQCTINPAAIDTPGVNPAAADLPCIVRTVAYDQTIQGKIQESRDTTILGYSATIKVDSVRLDSIAGLPTGITWVKNPNVLKGGENGCIRFTGTTTDTAGQYNLEAFGTVWLRLQASNLPIIGSIDTPVTRTGSLNQYSPFGDYYVRVVNQGQSCNGATTGISNNFSNELNSALSVFPNPNNGTFEFRLNAGQRINGSIVVSDVAGRVVFNQPLDVIGLYSTTINLGNVAKGLYTLQLRTENGFASKNISIE